MMERKKGDTMKLSDFFKVNEEIVKASRAIDNVLRWGSTMTVWRLIEDAEIVGYEGGDCRQLYVAAESWTDFIFEMEPDGSFTGSSHFAFFKITPCSLYVESTGGHWVSARLLEDGDLDINTDENPSKYSWGDTPDDDEPWLSSTEIRSMRIERIYRAMR